MSSCSSACLHVCCCLFFLDALGLVLDFVLLDVDASENYSDIRNGTYLFAYVMVGAVC